MNKNDVFKEKAKKVHNNKYDYSKVNYINSATKVCIICPEHGEFYQTPNNHLRGQNCPKCSHQSYKHTKETFIKKAREVHGDKYDYSKVEYVNNRTKVCIICPIHGEFYQTPNMHLKGKGCPKCGKESMKKKQSIDKETFIQKAKKIHGEKYDYSGINYVDYETPVTIKCPIHGNFLQVPHVHANGHGCQECAKIVQASKKAKTVEQFILEAKQIHGDKYDYSKVKYKGVHSKVCIICPIHGEFMQDPSSHLMGCGCAECGRKKTTESRKLTTEEWVNKAKSVHGDKYDYSKVEYINNRTKVCIICPIHGEFWQEPANHLYGKQGCPICKLSKLEEKTYQALEKNNIETIRQASKKNFKWLNKKTLDFYLPKHNIVIECQGEQHFIPHTFGSKKMSEKQMLEKVKRSDKIKKQLCKQNGVRLIYFLEEKHNKFMNEDDVYFNNINDLIEYILKGTD